MGRSRQVGGLRALLSGVTIAAMLAATAPAQAEGCTVTFRQINHFTYSAHNLPGYLISGSHTSPPGTEFRVVDDDGFLMLAMLMTSWQTSGKAQLNATSPVSISADEVGVLLAAADMGRDYQRTIRATVVERGRGAVPTYDQALSEATAKEAFMRELGEQVRARQVGGASPRQITLPAGFIRTRIGAFLSRLSPTSPQHMQTAYQEGRGDDNRTSLCYPNGRSVLIGRLLCSRDYETHALVDPTFCPDGLFVGDVSAVRRCRLRPDPAGGASIESECVSSFAAVN